MNEDKSIDICIRCSWSCEFEESLEGILKVRAEFWGALTFIGETREEEDGQRKR